MRKDKDKLDHGHEVSTARGRLEGALQILIERTESEGSDESDVDVTDLIHEGRSLSASPRKLGSIKTPLRKRRRLNVDKNYKNDQNSYVLKLYDRSVDLAKFSPQTSLYPVCRAWIKNQPNNQQFGSTSSNSPVKIEDKGAEMKEDVSKIEESSEADVNSLPLPETMPVDEEGNMIDTRIPLDLKPPGKPKSSDFLNIVSHQIYRDVGSTPHHSRVLLVSGRVPQFTTYYFPIEKFPNEDDVPSIASLLQEHCSHWGRVREQWRQAAAVNETRYAASTKKLKSILVRP